MVLKAISNSPTISSGAGVPSSTPSKVGDIYIDITAKKTYFATGTTSSADWTDYSPTVSSNTFKFRITLEDPNTVIELPIEDGGNSYLHNFTVSWGDGHTSTVLSYDDQYRIHTYVLAGTYDIELSGTCEYFNTRNYDIGSYIIELISFVGDIGFKLLCFRNCDNLDTIVPLGSFVSLTTAKDMFSGCENLLTLPANLFKNCTQLNTVEAIFSASGLTTIPIDLFKYNTLIDNYVEAFYGCTSLTGHNWGYPLESGETEQTVTGTIIYNAEQQPIPPSSTGSCFGACPNLTEVELIPAAWL